MSLEKSKTVVTLLGTGVTNGATVTARVDTLGFKRASVDLILGTANVVSNNPSVLLLKDGDTTAYTSGTTIQTGDTDFTIADSDTTNPNVYRFDVDCRGRRRYLFVGVSPTTTQEAVLVARLARGEDAPTSTTDLGVVNVVRI